MPWPVIRRLNAIRLKRFDQDMTTDGIVIHNENPMRVVQTGSFFGKPDSLACPLPVSNVSIYENLRYKCSYRFFRFDLDRFFPPFWDEELLADLDAWPV